MAVTPGDPANLIMGGGWLWEVVTNDSGGDFRKFDARLLTFSLQLAPTFCAEDPWVVDLIHLEEAPINADDVAPPPVLDGHQAELIRVLWAEFIDEALASATNAAAFQLAIWMVAYDPLELTNHFDTPIPEEITTLAETWLAGVKEADEATARASLMVLSQASYSDQLVEVVPAASGGLGSDSILTSLSDPLNLFSETDILGDGIGDTWGTAWNSAEGEFLRNYLAPSNSFGSGNPFNFDSFGGGASPGGGNFAGGTPPGARRPPFGGGGGGGGGGGWGGGGNPFPPVVLPPVSEPPVVEVFPPNLPIGPNPPPQNHLPDAGPTPVLLPEPSSLILWLSIGTLLIYCLRRQRQVIGLTGHPIRVSSESPQFRRTPRGRDARRTTRSGWRTS